MVATAIAERLHRDDFRLIEWYPHERERRFTEVALTAVPARPITQGLLVSDDEDTQPLSRNTAIACFASPSWERRTEDELAELLGQEAVRDLRSFAGMPGDYVPKRLFGDSGKRRADAIREHNRRVGDDLEAQVKKWTDL